MAGQAKPIEEYIIKLTPRLDVKEYERQREKLQGLLGKDFGGGAGGTKGGTSGGGAGGTSEKDKSDAIREKNQLNRIKTLKNVYRQRQIRGLTQLIRGKGEGAVALATGSGGLGGMKGSDATTALSAGTAGSTSAGIIAVAVVECVKLLTTIQKKVTSLATDVSNQMITAGSMFVNKGTRDIMTRFGVSGTTAMGISNVMSAMGISTEDMLTLTPAQQKLFYELMNTWTEGIGKIDKGKLTAFNDVTQNFQKMVAEFKLELLSSVINQLANNSYSLQSFFDSMKLLLNSILYLVNSGIVSQFVDQLLGLMTIINHVISLIAEMVGNIGRIENFFESTIPSWLFGKSSKTTNNITQINNNTYNGSTANTEAMSNANNSMQNNYLFRYGLSTQL